MPPISKLKFLFFSSLLFLNTLSFAWDTHPFFMPFVLRDLSPEEQNTLARPLSKDRSGDEEFYKRLSAELIFNPKVKLPPIQAESIRALLLSVAADEPDMGIDNNIEDPSADPRGDRPYMGGITGPTSRGFRHMYFGGWKLKHPLKTFQIPTRSLGLAPERAAILAEKARILIQSGNLYWGFRLLAWSMHHLQDLSQPFHATQVPTLRMPAWGELFSWPLGQAFGNLVKETTRIISNYHYAYEAYVYKQLSQSEKTAFKACLLEAKTLTQFRFDPRRDTPLQLAHEVAEKSVLLAREVGAATIGFFGKDLRKPEYDIPNGKGGLDYSALATLPQHKAERERLEQATCKALANGIVASRLALVWALQRGAGSGVADAATRSSSAHQH